MSMGYAIRFAVSPFKWSNLATNKAGVTVVVVGMDGTKGGVREIYYDDGKAEVDYINPYLTHHRVEIIPALRKPLFTDVELQYGVYYSKSAGLMLSSNETEDLRRSGVPEKFFRQFLGSQEFINGEMRYCLWIADDEVNEAESNLEIFKRIAAVRKDRTETTDAAMNKLASRPHQFRERKGDDDWKLFVPIVSSEAREYFPAGLASRSVIPTNKAFYSPKAPLWTIAVITSKLHLAWIGTICGRLEMRYSYSNTLGWNTFPIPVLTEKMKADLTSCANDILLAREAHFPATIAELYDPEKMPPDLPRR